MISNTIYTHVRVVLPVEPTTAFTALGTVFQEASYLPGLSVTFSLICKQTDRSIAANACVAKEASTLGLCFG
jgi:hypothetical protein